MGTLSQEVHRVALHLPLSQHGLPHRVVLLKIHTIHLVLTGNDAEFKCNKQGGGNAVS